MWLEGYIYYMEGFLGKGQDKEKMFTALHQVIFKVAFVSLLGPLEGSAIKCVWNVPTVPS